MATQLKMSNWTCNRCGECCHYVWKGSKKKCKFLVQHNEKFSCRIYGNHIGTELENDGENKIVCSNRDDDHRVFMCCPKNLF